MRKERERLFHISRRRYKELVQICLQYSEYKEKARDLLGLQAKCVDGMPRGSGISNPTARQAELRAYYNFRVSCIHLALWLGSGENNKVYELLKQNLCFGQSYYDLYKCKKMRKINKNYFFYCRRKALKNLDELLIY